MTLVIAAQGKDFVIVGTDSRATLHIIGGRVEINNIVQKLVPVSSHAAVLIYGASGPAQYLVDGFQSKNSKAGIGISSLVKDLANLCRKEARKLNGLPIGSDGLPRFGFIVAGLDKSGQTFSIPRCYELRSRTGFSFELCREGFAINGKPMIALYLFAKKYRRDMTVDELSKLVAQALYDTSKVDGDVGGRFRMAIIDSSGLREISEPDIHELIEDKWAGH